MKKIFFFALIISFFSLSGCYTMQGVGKDVKAGGKVIQKGAVSAQKQLYR